MIRSIGIRYLLALIVLSAAGVALLSPADCTVRDARDLQFFTGRHYWELSFDSLSVAAGVGMVSKDLSEQYTPRGRWTLLGIGVVGSLLTLTTMAAIVRRLQPWGDRTAPRLRTIFAAWLAWQAVLFGGLHAAAVANCPTVSWSESLWLVGNAFNGIGLTPGVLDSGTGMTAAIIGLLGSLGWLFWLLPVAWMRNLRGLPWTRFAKSGVGFVAVLGVIIACVTTFESSRGESRGGADDPSIGAQATSARAVRCAVQVVSAATAGLPTEPLGETGMRDASKAILAIVVMVGGMLGSSMGGLQWWVLALAITATMRERSVDARAFELRRAALRCFSAIVVLVAVVALGLLLIESIVATRFQRPAAFADALLDAASATCGANLSSGLIRDLISRNLVRGLNMPFDLFYLGLIWTMLAMLVGKVLPIWILASASPAQTVDPVEANAPTGPIQRD